MLAGFSTAQAKQENVHIFCEFQAVVVSSTPGPAERWSPTFAELDLFPAALQSPTFSRWIEESFELRQLVQAYLAYLGQVPYDASIGSKQLRLGLQWAFLNAGKPRVGAMQKMAALVEDWERVMPGEKSLDEWLRKQKLRRSFRPVHEWASADPKLNPQPPAETFAITLHTQDANAIRKRDIPRDQSPLLLPGEIFQDAFREALLKVQPRVQILNESMQALRQALAEGVVSEQTRAAMFAANSLMNDDELEIANIMGGVAFSERGAFTQALINFLKVYAEILGLLQPEFMAPENGFPEQRKIHEIAKYRLLPLLTELNSLGVRFSHLHKQLPVSAGVNYGVGMLNRQLTMYLAEPIDFSQALAPKRIIISN